MDKLLDSGKYSDLCITCQGKSWNVHRAIVCTASPVFAAMVDGEFQEAQSGIIDLPDDEPHIVEMMLRFIYQGEYDGEHQAPRQTDTAPKSNGQALLNLRKVSDDNSTELFALTQNLVNDSLVANAKVYIIADKNNILSLKVQAQNKYGEAAKILWDTPGFEHSARLIFECTPPNDALRHVVSKVAALHAQALVEKEGFVEFLTDHGELAVDMLKSVLLGKTVQALKEKPRKGKKANSWGRQDFDIVFGEE